MSAGLFGLLDDVAALAKLAAASIDDVGAAAGRASVKAAGVVVDDTAVTPQYVQNVAAQRELPIIRRIARGSLRNKLVFILPGALLLSQFLPWLVTPILMVGGAYLCYEGAEKVWERISGHHEEPVPHADPDKHGMEGQAMVEALDRSAEETTVAGAIRTDFILSTEIMVIALNEVSDEPLLSRALILVAVAFGITALVYGVVALIVKMDDVGLSLARRSGALSQRVGRGLVRGMPVLLSTISVVGIAAMLWVGGHIVLNGLHELGLVWPYDVVHDAEHEVEHWIGESWHAVSVTAGWLTNTLASAVLGLLLGSIVVAVAHVPAILRGGESVPDPTQR